MERFRRRRGQAPLERALRASAPAPRDAFLQELVDRVAADPGRVASRLRPALAIGLSSLFLAGLVALGAPSHVRAAASAVAQTAKETVVATTGGGSDNSDRRGGDDGRDDDRGGGGGDCERKKDKEHCGGGSGGGQYGHGTPICHRTGSSSNPWVLLVVPASAIPAHAAHGDLIPAPKDGCPKKDGKGRGKKTKPRVHWSPSTSLRIGDDASFRITIDVEDGSRAEGAVTCFEDDIEFDGAQIVDGEATCTKRLDRAGVHRITVVYSTGNSDSWESSESDGVDVTVAPAAAALQIDSSAPDSAPETPVTFTARVLTSAAAGAAPTGSVQFLDGLVPLGPPVPLGPTGVATLTTSSLRAGTHAVTAAYTGDRTYAVGAATITQRVAPAPPASTKVTYTGESGAVFGRPLTLSANVDGAPAGATVSIAYPGGSTTVGVGAATTITPTWVGSGTITISYAGDATRRPGSATATVTSTVPTTLTLSADRNPAPIDAPVTLTASISTPSGTTLPEGSAVTFFDGATSLGTATVSAGQASLTVGTLTAGTHSLSVSYAGNPSHSVLPGSSSLSETIVGEPTTVAYTGPANAYLGSTVTLTAATTNVPAGRTLTFTLPNGRTVAATTSGSGASASTTVDWTPASGSTIAVSFAGDSRRAGSSGTGSLVAFTRAVGIVVSSSANPVASGQSVTYTVSVTSSEVVNPQGSVTVYDNGAPLGPRTLGADGTATVAVTAGGVGPHAITATYTSSRAATWASGTSSALAQTVGKPAVTVSLATRDAAVEPGAPVTLTATVLPVVRVTALPTGTVQFREGTTVLGTATISSAGVASFSTSSLAVGSHAITAVYSGDATYDAGTSAALTQTVTQTPTATSLTVSSTTPSSSSLVLVGVGVTAKGAPLGGGSVTFLLDGTVLATVDVGDSGRAGYVLFRLAAGTHTLTAQYTPGKGGYAASSDSVTLTVAR